MAEDDFLASRKDEFVKKVNDLRGDKSHGARRPKETVLSAAKSMGIGSQVKELTYAALLAAADTDGWQSEDVSFWIEAAASITAYADGFEKDWIDPFTDVFFSKVSGVRDLPAPEELNLGIDAARRFRVMLQTVVAFAESKGKVGKTAILKCAGFRAVKFWGEQPGWVRDSGFTAEDRAVLRSLAASGGVVSGSADAKAKGPCAGTKVVASSGGLADAQRKITELEQKLKHEENRAYLLEQELKKQGSNLKQACEAEKAKCEQLDTAVADLRAATDMNTQLERDLDALSRQLDAEKESSLRQRQQWERQRANADNHEKSRHDAIADVVAPIRQQLDGFVGRPMTADVAGVLMTHLNRIISILKQNGFEI